MRTIILLAGVLLLLGCLGGGQPPPAENKTNVTNETNKTPITIITEEQKNQTIVKNETTQPPPPPPPPVNKSLEYEYTPDDLFGVFFIDVGGPGLHGDAIMIKKGDLDVLVDAGPQEKGGAVVDFLRSHEVDDIEVLVSTNADPRHYGGISAVADSFEIEEFWWNGAASSDADYSAIVARMQNATKTVRVVEDGFSTGLNGMNFTALNPPKADKFEDVNNDAIVLRLTDRNFSMLLTSGIQTGAQGLLTNEKPQEIKAQVIQAPYYGVGAGTSNIGIFLITAKPEAMVISGSSDDSAANGGSREPYKRLMTQYGITWYENYVNGTIRVSGDGQTYTIQGLGAG
jgi:competence protein ComEC